MSGPVAVGIPGHVESRDEDFVLAYALGDGRREDVSVQLVVVGPGEDIAVDCGVRLEPCEALVFVG